jgi:predicted DNA-binding protein (MmcQ/YjbR family)
MCLVAYAVVRHEGQQWYETFETVKRALLYLKLDEVKFEANKKDTYLLPPYYFSKSNIIEFSREVMSKRANKRVRELFLGLLISLYRGLPKPKKFHILVARKLFGKYPRITLGIRDFFQVTFLLSAFVFLGFLIFSYVTLR